MTARPDLELRKGAIDMHLHTMPCPFEWPLDDAELAAEAKRLGLRTVVVRTTTPPPAAGPTTRGNWFLMSRSMARSS